MGLRKIFDKLGDALMPKELAPYAGTLATLFAGPLGMGYATALGQLGSAKMNSGKLDPYTALATGMSAQSYKARNPKLYGRVGDSLTEGIGGLLQGEGFGGFSEGFMNPSYYNDVYLPKQQALSQQQNIANIKKANAAKSGGYGQGPGGMGTQQGQQTVPTLTPSQEKLLDPGFFDPGGTADAFTQNVSEAVMPGFTTDNKFDLAKTIQTVGAATTLTQIMPIAEELKKQKMKDKAEEQKVYRAWFEQYERVTGSPYSESPYPESYLTDKFNEIYNATGGRIGYNLGGSTGIIAAAPGMPTGMQLDGRDGMFISQGVEEKADDVPAMLSKNEFVLTADAMAGLDKMNGGSGDPRAAAKEMYRIMDQLEAMA
jgi:hypothetical protein